MCDKLTPTRIVPKKFEDMYIITHVNFHMWRIKRAASVPYTDALLPSPSNSMCFLSLMSTCKLPLIPSLLDLSYNNPTKKLFTCIFVYIAHRKPGGSILSIQWLSPRTPENLRSMKICILTAPASGKCLYR